VVNNPEDRLLLDSHFYYSGAIPRVSSFEKGRDDHLCRTSSEASWEPDPLLMDERMLVAQVRGLGLIVFSACSHASIVNVCTHVRSLFPDLPIYAVMYGRPPSGKKLLTSSAHDLERSCIRPVNAVGC
jgi:7,8-dihydropterin-6-yl-methyl-4-(beta-D-ribofuranosyl)aminobenzene 5'-phosphate synthase